MNPIEKRSQVNGADPSWKGFYTVGGISALLYVLLGLVVPTVIVFAASYDFSMDGPELLKYIAAHKVQWIVLQTLVLGTSILAIITFASLFVALKQINKSMAALGAVITATCQVLFMAYYPVLLGLGYLSDRYVLTTSELQRSSVASSAEALLAMNNAFNPLYESVFAVGIMIFSLVMLKGVFPRSIAWLGIANAPAAIIALFLWPLVGVGYFWWWLLFVVWFTAVGWKLVKMGKTRVQ